MEWLRSEFTKARDRREHVWVLAHIPPGVDPYTTALKMRDVCGGQSPEMFLASDELAGVLRDFSDVVQLVLFGHTHFDEVRFLKSQREASPAGVAVKLVPSISPINGNRPAFTLAYIDAANAMLMDYRVYAASNQTGVNAEWSEKYDFAQTYQQPSFSAATVDKLIAGFKADPGAKSAPSQSYLRNLGVRQHAFILTLLWPQFVCGLSNTTAETFKACLCADMQEPQGTK